MTNAHSGPRRSPTHKPGEEGRGSEKLADLLDPKWRARFSGTPAYSGTIMNATFQIARDLGWTISKARQAARHAGAVGDRYAQEDSLGERAVMADGAGYLSRYREAGQPVDIVYPEEARRSPPARVRLLKAAPNPNAARLSRTDALTRGPATHR